MRKIIVGAACIRSIFISMAAGMATLSVTSALAESSYPDHPIRLIVPYSPGGTTDLISRIVARGLSKELGQQVVVDNKAGAAGTIGTAHAINAKPDGYTLGMGGTTSLTIAPYLRKDMPYDSRKDLTPIGIVATGPFILVTSPRVNASTFKVFVDTAKASPGKFNYGSSGVGGMHHVLTEKFNRTLGIDAVHVPFKGGGENTSNLLAGNIDYMLESVSSILPMIQDGRVKALAVTSAKRLAALPDVPTVAELTGTDFKGDSIIGIVGPDQLPAPVIARLDAALAKTMKNEEVRKGIELLGSTPEYMPSQGFAELIDSEVGSWGKVAKDAAIPKQ
jgi:tripartite-type tricarboxylate transporter receptor subunit TctC